MNEPTLGSTIIVDGYYYFTGSVPGYQSIEIRRAKSLNDLEKAETKNVWRAPKDGPMSQLIWAPEIHFIQGNGISTLLHSDHGTISQ